MINIIAGKYKRKKIEIPIHNVRPTSAIKREAIFSIIESYALKNSYNIYSGKCFIDLFAGSGSFGLEAISRGAAFSYFFEIDNEVLNTLSLNCKNICKENQFRIYHQDSTQLINVDFDYPVSGIFIDPPYKLNPFNNLLKKLMNQNIIQQETITIIETSNKMSFELINGLSILSERVYGKTKILFLKKN